MNNEVLQYTNYEVGTWEAPLAWLQYLYIASRLLDQLSEVEGLLKPSEGMGD